MSGRPFLQIPGPTLVPERIVRAMSQSIIDHRGPKFAALVGEILTGLRTVFQTERGQPILSTRARAPAAGKRPSSTRCPPATGSSAVVNGHFSNHFCRTAAAPRHRGRPPRGALRRGRARPLAWPERLRADPTHQIRAVLVVHNETSTGVTSDVAAVRRALDEARHPALLLVDVVSSLASIDFRFDEWGVDVALTGPRRDSCSRPGLTILAASDRAVRASQAAKCPRAYWDWGPVLERNKRGEFPVHARDRAPLRPPRVDRDAGGGGPARVFRRHARLAEACRRAVAGPRARHPLPRAARALEHADRRGHARGLRLGRLHRPRRTGRSTSPSGSGSATSRARCSGSATWAA